MKVLIFICALIAVALGIEPKLTNLNHIPATINKGNGNNNINIEPKLTNLNHISATINKGNVAIPYDGKIIGGGPAILGQIPYQAALEIDTFRYCGGSILNDRWVLTSGQCTFQVRTISARVGSLKYDIGGQNIVSSSIHTHPGYIEFNYFINDVGLVHLSSPLVFDNSVGSVRLPLRSQINNNWEGQTGTVSGWGYTQDGGSLSSVLNYVTAIIISNVECANVYGSVNITDCNICIEKNGGTVGICSGDAGGPLTIVDTDGLPTQIGVVSYAVLSSPSCTTNNPDWFAKTTCHLDWIQTITNITVP